MKLVKYLFVIFFISCGSNEARRPVMVKTNTFLKESAQKNRLLLTQQEFVIDSIVKQDTLHTYLTSKDGFKYYYITQNKTTDYTPKFGDVVEFMYNVSDIYGNEIYSKEEKKKVIYHVDKEELFLGLRTAIKMLKEQEEAVFYFPSEIAFGYHGDKNRIGVNKPVVVQVQVIKVTPTEQ